MKKQLFFKLFFVIVLVVMVTGCGVTSASPTPTLATLPTSTPIPPTATSVPTVTQTAVPTNTPEPTTTSTPTPDKTAIAQVLATQTAEVIMAKVSKELETVGLSTDTGHLMWAQDKPVKIAVNSYDEELFEPFMEEQSASDFVLKTDVTWESTSGLAICGFKFRSEKNFEEGKQYQYVMTRLSGLPLWAIEYYQNGEFSKSVSQARTNGAIDQDQRGANKIILIAEGEKFTLYINDIRVGNFYDYSKSLSDGYFAFEAYQESGQTTCTFSDTWVWALK